VGLGVEGAGPPRSEVGPEAVTLLLDTHFLIWAVLGSRRLERHPWIEGHRPWGVSPVSLLEIQLLSEVGRLELEAPRFFDTLSEDARFVIDEPPLLPVVRQALTLGWTRDPFDRLLVAHSLARRVPLCTVDAEVHRHHALIPAELRSPA